MLEIIATIGIPTAAAAVAMIRYFWKKERCFLEMKNKIDELSKRDISSESVHAGLQEEIEDVKNRQQKNEIYLKLILTKFNIPYDQ